jgi:LCP family protein required for cell wall assembly
MPQTGIARRSITRKALYSLVCVASAVVLAASGFSYFVVRDVSSIGSSHAIPSGPSIGAQNILLMGLESRRDWNGNILPKNVLNALHAGSAQGVANGVGGNDTNTLILIHIPAGGKKAIGFSIPRDDWVSFAGTVGPQQQGKIDQAYGVSMFYQQAKLKQQNPKISQDRLAFLGNEAGRKAAVDTVEQLTGVHIDHFAEVNLDGFYELAKVLGGVQVCLNHAVKDANSGADFHAGYQHLNASQALAFVRQRDGLPNGDLDRTHRQQAFLDSVMEQLRNEGVFSDLTKINALLSVAKQYVITDSSWNLLDFAAQMRDLTSSNLVFRTLPIKAFATIDGQDANEIDPANIKAIVQSTFYPKPAAPSGRQQPRQTATPTKAITVDVLNGGNTHGLASRVSSAFVTKGYSAGQIGNTTARSTTAVLYGTGAAANANSIAGAFGVTAAASSSVAPDHVEILLGADVTRVPNLTTPATSTPSTAPTTGPQGGAVGAQSGIPCVN